MSLIKEVKLFLDGLQNNRSSFFFPVYDQECLLLGCLKGSLVCLVVKDGKDKLTKKELKFVSRITQADGDFHYVRSMDDICLIAKLEGWHD